MDLIGLAADVTEDAGPPAVGLLVPVELLHAVRLMARVASVAIIAVLSR
jgi:hypothetical protein